LLDVFHTPLSDSVIHAFVDTGMWTLFWQWNDSSRHRIQVDIRCHG
jgi:hypothetical protein